MKCKKLTVENFYGIGNPLIVLGVIVSDDDQTFTFKTGTGKKYTISKSYQHKLVDTKQDFNQKL